MDPLALLCNLYGDGPATLRRLREAGVGSLEAIEEAEPERLAGLLRTSVRSARRFQVEGHLLHERTAAAVEGPSAQRGKEAPTDPLLRKVLETWRRMDAEDPSPADEVPAPAEPRPEVGGPPREESAALPGTPLDGGCLDGLDASTVRCLSKAGVATLEGLARCDALATSRASGVPYTHLLRLQLLARRSLPVRPASVPEGAPSSPAPSARELLVPSPPPLPSRPRLRPAHLPVPTLPQEEQRFSPAEGPSEPLQGPLDPILGRQATQADPADDPAGGPGEPQLGRASKPDDPPESAGPFA